VGTGIPVPPVIPEGSKAFTICVPDDPFFYGVVMGLLKQATFKYYWAGTDEQVTAVTERMLIMYYGYQDQAGCMDCEQVADCIENDEGTQDAIANAIRSSTSIQNALRDTYDPNQPGVDMPESVSGENVAGENPGCDLDVLWGWIIAGVNEMDTNNRDAQEVFEGLSNQWERISTVLSGIPGVGVLPVDEVVRYAQGLWSDDLFEAYEANDTLTYRRALACDLFCLAQANDCQLTLDMMLNYFLERITYSGSQTLGNIVSYLVAGTWTGTQINDTFYLAQLLFLKFGNAFFKLIGIKPIQIMFQLGEASNAHTLLCEDCPAEYQWENVGIIGSCGEGVKSSGDMIPGEAFDVEAYNDTTYPAYWTVALKLPPGDWNVALNSITGTIVPPGDLNESAWAYMDTTGTWQQAQWNTPATPADFGSHDTTATIFTVWCSTQDWNAYLSNCGAFTANFTVTPA